MAKRTIKSRDYPTEPDLSVQPIADWDTYVRSRGIAIHPTATFGVEYFTVKGGYVPVKHLPAVETEYEVEYLSVGELKKVLKGVPDDTPVYIDTVDDDGDSHRSDATWAEIDSDGVFIL